jgi:hypothetical protein
MIAEGERIVEEDKIPFDPAHFSATSMSGAVTMEDIESIPNYNNDRWFRGKKKANARKILKRWTEEKYPKDMKFCGMMYAQFFNYKISQVLHQTQRTGTRDFYECYARQGYYLLKYVFRPKFLKVIRQEVLRAQPPSWDPSNVSMSQVMFSALKNIRLEDPDNNGGCTFLHHFLTGVSVGSFPGKTLFELVLIKTAPGANTANRKWNECKFHTDFERAPDDLLDKEESPMTLYFAVQDSNLELDLKPRKQNRGRKPQPRTVKLNPGDILLFDTCKLKHRTTTPTTRRTPVRANIVMTGFESFINHVTESIAPSDASSSDSED